MGAISGVSCTGCFSNPFAGMTIDGTTQKVRDFAVEAIKTAIYLPFLLFPFNDLDGIAHMKVATWLQCYTAVRVGVFVEHYLFGASVFLTLSNFLTVAAMRGDVSFVEWMLDNGFPHCHTRLKDVVRTGNSDMVKLLVDRGISLEGVFDVCIPDDDPELFRYLLQNGAQFGDVWTTLLNNAVFSEQVEVVRILIEYNILAQENIPFLREKLAKCANQEIVNLVNEALERDQ